jgi:hypothetical protein
VGEPAVNELINPLAHQVVLVMNGMVRGHRYQAGACLRLPLDLLAQAPGSEVEKAVANPLEVGPVRVPNVLANGLRIIPDQRIESRSREVGHRVLRWEEVEAADRPFPVDHGMEDLENGALGERHLRGLAHRHEPGLRLHGLSLKFMALEREGGTHKANLVRVRPHPGIKRLGDW